MKYQSSFLMAIITCLGSGLPAFGQDDTLKTDSARIQGKWERIDKDSDGNTIRTVKEHKDGRTTFTKYIASGEVIGQHKSQYKLDRTAEVNIFRYTKLEVTEGKDKGLKYDDEYLFAYRFIAGQFYEYRGVLAGDSFPPGIVVWTRSKAE